ncbi:MAG: efflux RND transporter permease subunit [Methylococcaceae bacterium]|nr:efflux RND transporter permease subunit [Methylococcaceae bacterium]
MSARSRAAESLLGWFAANPVAANLLMVLIFLGGLASVQTTVKQAYPRFAPEAITITAEYPDAGPAEVEESVCIPIEEAIHDLQGIKRLMTEATSGECKIEVQIEQGYRLADLTGALRSRVQSVRNLPKPVERIHINDTGWESPAISVVLYGDSDKLTLRRLAEQVRDDLNTLDGVRNAKLWGTATYEIAIEIPQQTLRQQQLTLAGIGEAIRRSSLDLPGGLVKAPAGEFQLRAWSTAYEREKLLDLTLRTYPDGTLLKLGDIATISDGFGEQRFENRSEGKPSETIGVIAEQDLVEVAKAVTAYVEELKPQLPEGIEIITRRDNARSFSELFDTLIGEGISGFLLVLGVLMLFLRTSVALWASVGVLISVFGALWGMPFCGVTLNMLSLFGFVLSMGVLVDDAIIVSDRVNELQSKGLRGLEGAIRGVQDVALPVILGVLIGLIAFLPGLFVPPSWATRFMMPVAVVMILSLVFSLIEALLILPAHLAHESKIFSDPKPLIRLRAMLNAGLDRFIRTRYQPFLRRVIDWRYLTLSLFGGLIVIGMSLIAGDYVKVSLEEDVGYDNFHVHLMPPAGTPYPETVKRVEQFKNALRQAEAELNRMQPADWPPVIEGLDIFINETDPTIWVEFSSEARQRFHIRELIERWYRHVGDVGDFRPDFHTPTEQDIVDLEIEFGSSDPSVLNAAVEDTKTKLADYPDIVEIEDSRRPGKPELRLKLTAEAERLGLRLRDLAEQVRQAYFGEEAQRFIRGREEVRIMLRNPRAERESLNDLRTLPVRLVDGGQAPLGALAEIGFAPGFGALSREDRRGVAGLHVRLEQRASLSGDALFNDLKQNYFPALESRYPSLEISAGAAKEEAEQVAESLKQNTGVALTVIYALIAVAFRSYLQPFLFMLAVPVAWTGAVLIHWTLGLTLSFQSLVGMVAASGVVVNDSVVLLDFIRKRRETDSPLGDVIIEACADRFRPISLVALTTLSGFFPMLFVTSEQANFLVPMTLSLTFGLVFGLAATLILTPACYAVLEDIAGLTRRQGVPRSVRRIPGND